MKNERLLSYRRALNKQAGNSTQPPLAYFPSQQQDEVNNGKIQREFRNAEIQKQLSAGKIARENVSHHQNDASAKIARCTTATIKLRLTTTNKPTLILPQNPMRIFMGISCGGSAQAVGGIYYTFGNTLSPTNALSNPFAFDLPIGEKDIYNSSVIPIDDIYVMGYGNLGANDAFVVTLFEGISPGNLQIT